MFFRKEKQAEETQSQDKEQEYSAAPGTDIRFDPSLIAGLKGDHQTLLSLYRETKSAFDAKRYKAVSEKLDKFRSALQAHLLTENIRLYIYLSHMFKTDETNFELIRGFRREMDDIAKTALNFLRKYEAIGVDPELAPSFEKDFDIIGQVLGTRIQKEESVLYPLYVAQY